MKKSTLSIALFCLVILAVGFIYIDRQQTNKPIVEKKAYQNFSKKIKDRAQSYIGAQEYLIKMKADPITGRINPADMLKARQAADAMAANQPKKSAPINWEFMGPNNVGGRTRAILMDKDNPEKMIIGGVSGGIFTSDDGGLFWENHPQNTEFASLAISSITQAPNGDIYVGTGEYQEDGISYGEPSSKSPGTGIYKSIDRGVSFQLLESTVPTYSGSNLDNDDWVAVLDIKVSPINTNLIYAATNRGLQISEDGGLTWYKPSNIPPSAIAYSIAIADNGTVHLLAGSRYYRAVDGFSFSSASTGGLPGQFEISARNKVLAMSPSDNAYLYIVTIDNSLGGCLNKVWQSKNGGDTWVIIAEGGTPYFAPLFQGLYCQGFYDLCVTVDPANKERIFLGGITLWSWSSTDSWNQLDLPFDSSPHYVHADKHTIVFHPTNPNIMYIGSDGGISRSLDAQNPFPTFKTLNKNYNVTQFYGIAADNEGRMIGGTQDNGTSYVNFEGNSAFAGERMMGGDGGYCEISKLNPRAIFAATQMGALRRTSKGEPPFSTFFDSNIDCAPITPQGTCDPDGMMDGNPSFITPFVLWEDIIEHTLNGVEESVFVTGSGNSRVWMTRDALNFTQVPAWIEIGKFSGTREISAVAVSNNGKTAYAGTADGRIMRINNIDSPNPTANEFVVSSGQYITSIDVDFNPAHIVVGLGIYGRPQNIVESNNFNTSNPTFSSIQHNLPLMPVYSIAIDPFIPTRIFAGTELGVWMYDGVSKTWTEENGIMGRVPVHSLRFQQMKQIGCEVLYAGTHGRGMYRTVDFTLEGCDTSLPYPQYTDIDDLEDEISSMKLFPNPMINSSTLEISLTKPSQVSVRIFDLQGRMVRNQDFGKLSANLHQLSIEKGDLAAGTYIVMVYSENSNPRSKKLIIE